MPTGMPESDYLTDQLDVLRHEFGFVAFAEYGTKSYGLARRALEEAAKLRTELAAVRAELADHLTTECTDTAAGQNAERAERAEAEVRRLRNELSAAQELCDATQTTLNAEFELSCQFRTERDAATARAEQAEAALTELRERLGKTGEQWGVRGGGGTFAVLDEAEARWHMFDSSQPMIPVCRVVGEWRDATPRNAAQRAADEQGVREGGDNE